MERPEEIAEKIRTEFRESIILLNSLYGKNKYFFLL